MKKLFIIFISIFLSCNCYPADTQITAFNRTGLTLEWLFGNSNGTSTVYNTSGYGLTGTETGAITFVQGLNGYIQYIGGGANNYISYSPGTDPYASNEISIVIKYAPSFAAGLASNRPIFDSSGGRYCIIHNSGGTLITYLGGTAFSIGLGVYSAYWKVNEPNVFIIVSSATTDRTDLYLNGNKVINQSTTAWAQTATTKIFIGGNSGAAGNGKWYSFRIFNRLLTTAEINAFTADRSCVINTSNSWQTTL